MFFFLGNYILFYSDFYCDYDGLITLTGILKDKFEDINVSINNISTSPIDLEDITWDNLSGQ